MTVPGYGSVWQPYFIAQLARSGWRLAFYPGFGYMFVSGYPWGWMPFNYGNWAFAPGFGWLWQPGNWNSWNALPLVVNAPVGTKVPTPPVSGRQTVMVGRGLGANPGRGAPRVVTIIPAPPVRSAPRSVDTTSSLAKTMGALLVRS